MYKGIVCDRSKQDGKQYMTRQECDKCVQSPTHPCPFHGKMLAKMWGDGDREPSADSFSPTRVLGCRRKKWFAARSNDYHELLDPYTGFNPMRGHFFHSLFEANTLLAPGTQFEVSEIRFQTHIKTKYGVKLFLGKPDLIEVKEDRGDVLIIKVVDWKSMSEVKHDFLEARESHQFQVNMYAWLLYKELPKYLKRDVQVIVDELEIVYLDMKKVRRFTTKSALSDRGKLKIPRRLKEYESIELKKMNLANMAQLEIWIGRKVEEAIESTTTLYAPLEGDEAKLCDYCSFQAACVKKWNEEER